MSRAFDDLGAPDAPPSGSDRNSADALRDDVRAGTFGPPEVDLVSNHHRTTASPQHAFEHGTAGALSPRALAAAGVFDASEPLIGSVFERTERVKFIILHSTETRSPADAERVIESWNNRRFQRIHSGHGRHGHGHEHRHEHSHAEPHYRVVHHPGSQFIIDRDGTIFMAANPDKKTIHLNDRLTHGGVTNNNAVGIEMVHTGHQTYTPKQKASLVRLVSYLQDHYHVSDSHVETHGHVQPRTRTDPVHFDLEAFDHRKHEFRLEAHNNPHERRPHQEDA
jgi:hypothetical protein